MKTIKTKKLKLVVPIILIYLFCFPLISGAAISESDVLSSRQKSIVDISALTATGQISSLKDSLNSALDNGMTVNEVQEVLVHVYAYAGFPRSFNGMMAFMGVMDERQSKGIKDEVGNEASPLPADLDRDAYGAKVRAQLGGSEVVPPPAKWQTFSPLIDKFLKEHLFADLFARDVLSFADRELATVAILASLPGLEGPLNFHLGAAMNMGLSQESMEDFVAVVAETISQDRADAASKVLKAVVKKRH